MQQQHEQRLLLQIIHQCIPSALRYATGLTGNPHDAEDLVQESLLTAAARVADIRHPDKAAAWFFSVLMNQFRRNARRGARTVVAPAVGGESTGVAEAEDRTDNRQQQTDEYMQQLHQLRAAVDRLPARQREVLELITWGERTVAEAAEVLDISEQNVHSSLHAARSRLKEIIARETRQRGDET